MKNKTHNRTELKLRTTFAAFLFLAVLFSAANNAAAADTAGETGTRRFGIFIGSNSGGKDRAMLRYAVSDARSVSKIFAGMGGVTGGDNILLVEPAVNDINAKLDSLKKLADQSKQNNQRTELIFYYSGHSDEDGLLLNRENYGYRELRDCINNVGADMTIVILDSCSSGAITRAKGGVKTQPFLFDSSVSAAGYAFLTSSSADEASQESDVIESSYFTNSLLTGLRGAADSVGDGRVTLNELYRFAYTETLARTETSMYGAQHPSYDIQISGTGDVVLTDIKEISAGLIIGDDLAGRISIRDKSDFLVAELTKTNSKPLALGLEPGLYRITLQKGDNFYRAEIRLTENQTVAVGMADFALIAAASGSRIRGGVNEDGIDWNSMAFDDGTPLYPINFQIIPGLDIFGHNSIKATNNFLLGSFIAIGHNVRGIGTAGLGLVNSGYIQGIQSAGLFSYAAGPVQGVQASGLFNISGDFVQGIQSAGLFNIAGPVQGIQSSSLFNIANGTIQGVQAAGLVNYTGGLVQGIQAAGVFNIAGGSIQGVQAAGLFNYTHTLMGIQAAPVNVNTDAEGKGAMFGVVNVSRSQSMVPFGVINVIDNGIFNPAIYIDDMLFKNFSFRSGSKYFYTILSTGANFNSFDINKGFIFDGGKFLSNKYGFGFELPVKSLFLDLDFLGGSIINLSNLDFHLGNHSSPGAEIENSLRYTTITAQARLTIGFKVFRHLGIFAGLSWDYFYRHFPESPNPLDMSNPAISIVYGKHTQKLGFFGGIQF